MDKIDDMDMTQLFRSYSDSIQTGLNFSEANTWFNELLHSKEDCLVICMNILVQIDFPETNGNSLFFAVKLIHKLSRDTHNTAMLAFDRRHIEVISFITSLFSIHSL